MNQPNPRNQTNSAAPLAAETTNGAAQPSPRADLAQELQQAQQQLQAAHQKNQQLLRQNRQLRAEVEQIMASALNLHQIVSAQPVSAQPGDSNKVGPNKVGSNEVGPVASDSTAAPAAAAPAVTPSAASPQYPEAPSAVDRASGSPLDSATAGSGIGGSEEDDAEDMFAELDRLLTEDPQPSSDDSLQNALNYVNSRYRAVPASSASRPEKAASPTPPLQPKPPTNLRRTVASSPQPAATAPPPRRFNIWMLLATILVMVSCFGASFFVVLSMLQSSDR